MEPKGCPEAGKKKKCAKEVVQEELQEWLRETRHACSGEVIGDGVNWCPNGGDTKGIHLEELARRFKTFYNLPSKEQLQWA